MAVGIRPEVGSGQHLTREIHQTTVAPLSQNLAREVSDIVMRLDPGRQAEIAADLKTLRTSLFRSLSGQQNSTLPLVTGALLAGPAGASSETVAQRLHALVASPADVARLRTQVEALEQPAEVFSLSTELSKELVRTLGARRVATGLFLGGCRLGVHQALGTLPTVASVEAFQALPAASAPAAKPEEPKGFWQAVKRSFSKKGSQSTLAHKGVALACGLGGLAIAGHIAWQVACIPTLPGKLIGAAAVMGSAVAGYALSEFPVGAHFHHWFDNYSKGPLGVEFQRHHDDPNDIRTWGFCNAIYGTARGIGPLLGLVAFIHPPVLAAGALTLVGGTIMSNALHKWSHERDPNRVKRWAQDHHVILGRDQHIKGHHVQPWDQDYGITNGWSNPLLRKIEYWRRFESVVYRVRGKVANSWKDPEVAARAMYYTQHGIFAATPRGA